METTDGVRGQDQAACGENCAAPVPPRQREVRLLLWGGAAKPGDNSAFEWAARNVIKDYQAADNGDVIIVEKRVRVARDIVNCINGQADSSIRSLDIFTHGGPQALYLTTAGPDTNELLRKLAHNASLYRSRTRMVANGAGWTKGSALVREINFANFSVNARIELHGCKAADAGSDTDNIAGELSTRLSDAGKASAVVIGHADAATPNIKGGGERMDEQDYRHGQRVVFSKGRIVKLTRQQGHLSEQELAGLEVLAET